MSRIIPVPKVSELAESFGLPLMSASSWGPVRWLKRIESCAYTFGVHSGEPLIVTAGFPAQSLSGLLETSLGDRERGEYTGEGAPP